MNINQKCCKAGLFWLNGRCQEVPRRTIPNCSQQTNEFKCAKCNNSYVLTNGYCCESGKVFNGYQCVQVILDYESNNNLCQTYDDQFECAECIQGFYPSNKKCCPIYTYYNLELRDCVAINIKGKPCAKFSEGQCLECVSSLDVLFEGFCVNSKWRLEPRAYETV